MDRSPDFFMSTAGEHQPLAAPRACWKIARLRDKVRDDYMLIAIEPVLDGQRFGLGATEIKQLVIYARSKTDTVPYFEGARLPQAAGGDGRICRDLRTCGYSAVCNENAWFYSASVGAKARSA
jgi:hypothetical protein